MDEKTKRLLELLDKKTRRVGGAERALYCLLDEFKQVLPSVDDYFHKAFRQIDVTPSGSIDSAIWHLIGSSRCFWKCFEQVQSEDQTQPNKQ